MKSDADEARRQQDIDLIEEVRHGRQEAFAALVKRYEKLVGTCVWHFVRDSALTEDFVQEIFIKAFVRLGSLKELGHFKVWLLQIARNHCLDYLRKKRIPAEDLGELEATGKLPGLAQAFVPIEDSVMITMLEHVSPQDAELLWLRFVESVSYEELSTITGLQEPALRKRISRGLNRLRGMLR